MRFDSLSTVALHLAVLAAVGIVGAADAGAYVFGNADSNDPGISGDGRYVAFESLASDLVANDTNARRDIFVLDRQTGALERVSVDSAGTQGNGNSLVPSISADGRYVAFHSTATNLVAGDTNAGMDCFVHDRQTGTTRMVSVDSAGTIAASGAASLYCRISGNGQYAVYRSSAANLVAGDANNRIDIFIHNLQTSTTERVSTSAGGTEGNLDSDGPSVSSDGRFVAFMSGSTNLVPSDTNGQTDIFLKDRLDGTISLVSVGPSDVQANGSCIYTGVSDDGNYVVFGSSATNLVTGDTNGSSDIFVRDRLTSSTTRVSVGPLGVQSNGGSQNPVISADGNFIAYASAATNLVASDTNARYDIFVHSRLAGTTRRASVDSAGAQSNGDSSDPDLSSDGQYVAFDSVASNLVAGDSNGFTSDIFVNDELTGATTVPVAVSLFALD